MARSDEVRLMTKVARMYYDQGIRQQKITERLNLHQSKVSRLLQKARDSNIVRITVALPSGLFLELEEALEARYGLKEVIVVDTADNQDEARTIRDLGAAAAFFVETNLKRGATIGVSSWSRALVAMVDSLHQSDGAKGGKVVQILGGVGNPSSQYHANYLIQILANRIGATPVILQAPAIVGSAQVKQILSKDSAVSQASALFDKLDIALVGIGAVEPSKLLASSGNIFSAAERKRLTELGAVGDICMRFVGEDGKPIKSPLMDRVIGIDLETLRKSTSTVGIAGGHRKLPAIQAVLNGGWINVLITDRLTAERLVHGQPSTSARPSRPKRPRK